MNATGSNTTPLGLLAMLGQNPDSGLSALMMPGESDAEFSAVMAELMSPVSTTPESAGGLSLLQTLPPGDEGLPQGPLLPQLMVADGEVQLPAQSPAVDDLLGRIEQAQSPLAIRTIQTTDETAAADAASDEESVAGLADGESDDDAQAVMYSPLAVAATPASANSASTPADKPLSSQTGLRQKTLGDPRVAPDSRVHTEPAEGADSELVDGLAADEPGSDFYLPEEQRRMTPAVAAQTTANVAQQAAPTATLQTPLAAAIAAHSEQPDASSASAEELSAEAVAEAEMTQAEQIHLRRERLEFGQDRREWGGALGARILTMVAEDVQEARIQLDPPELGSLEVKVRVSQEQATIQVHAQNPQVREVLEASAHRLRDALSGQGLTLHGFDVSDQSSSSGSGFAGQGQGDGQGQADGWSSAETDDEMMAERPAAISSHSLLDTFA